MSQENVENTRRGIDAWNRGDLDEWLADLIRPDRPRCRRARFVPSHARAGVGSPRIDKLEVTGSSPVAPTLRTAA
jgi:hypothetical protein